MTSTPLVEIRDLVVEYRGRGGLARRPRTVRVFDRLSLDVGDRETLAVVGESGSGKTTLVNVLAGLLEPISGTIRFAGEDLLNLSASARWMIRRDIQVVFQNPHSSLNPRMRVRDIVAEPLVTHERLTTAARTARVEELLVEVGVGPELHDAWPRQLSGGQAQRVAIARAIALAPRLLLLDEPTSSLDLSVQAQVLNLLQRLARAHHFTSLLVSHDLAVVQHLSDRVAVMYLGEIVERGAAMAVFANPQHPYTQALVSAGLTTDPDQEPPPPPAGEIPSLSAPPSGCRYHTRCPFVMEKCLTVVPPAYEIRPGHRATCHLLEGRRDTEIEVNARVTRVPDSFTAPEVR